MNLQKISTKELNSKANSFNFVNVIDELHKRKLKTNLIKMQVESFLNLPK